MENKPKEFKIEVPAEVASGRYSNFAVISHSPNEVFIDFITLAPNMPQAKVESRIIMTPDNARNLLAALSDNLKKYEATFGEIRRIAPVGQPGPNDLPNPFAGGSRLN
ncbi:MAG: DUF3467 domain-containing protein [Muribaculaceae bacterium]|nr:DUF3467 domain-containing protein [Muribaculaceae bacterium]